MIVQLPIPATLVDMDGTIYGYLDSEGLAHEVATSNVGKQVLGWDDVLKKKVPIEVTWDGAAPPTELLGRGELVHHPDNLTHIHRKLGGPRFKTVNWGPRTVEAASEFDTAEEQE